MCSVCFCVFCTAPAATENYTYCHSLSLRVALPIWKAITLAAPLHPVIDGAILMRNLHAARIERRDFCGRIIGTDDRRIILRALLQPLLVGKEDNARENDDQRDDGEHDDGAAAILIIVVCRALGIVVVFFGRSEEHTAELKPL